MQEQAGGSSVDTNNRSRLRSRRTVFSDPLEDFIVPVATIRRFCDPVPFIREVNELAGNPLTLQCRKRLLTFTHGNSKVEIIVDDQHRCFEIGRQSMRRMLLVRFTI